MLFTLVLIAVAVALRSCSSKISHLPVFTSNSVAHVKIKIKIQLEQSWNSMAEGGMQRSGWWIGYDGIFIAVVNILYLRNFPYCISYRILKESEPHRDFFDCTVSACSMYIRAINCNQVSDWGWVSEWILMSIMMMIQSWRIYALLLLLLHPVKEEATIQLIVSCESVCLFLFLNRRRKVVLFSWKNI